ncbi:MAG TPA: hypothetical protein VNU68_14005 [Verrucomicrobiae bacterium]|nr:hypothetical protein [Verrucomicrobiae bacterium]
MTCRNPFSTRDANSDGRGLFAPQTPSALLDATPSSLREKPVYAYIVTTIKTTAAFQLHQEGSAPNFEGARITLCTCKHKDRATFHSSSYPDDPWKNVWVAGLTSKSDDPSRALAYLMCIERSFLNQRELWHALPGTCRLAKSACKCELGDLYEPKAAAKKKPYDPANYCRPIDGHVHAKPNSNEWHKDIRRWGNQSRPHRLLLGREESSYRWLEVKMILKLNAMGRSAHHRIYGSLREFIDHLQAFDP